MGTWNGGRTAPHEVLLPQSRLDSSYEEAPQRQTDPDRSMVYLHFEGLAGPDYSAVGRSLERLSRRLWGSPTLVPLGSADFALMLDGWSAVRCRQLCQLLERAFEGGLRRLGEGVRMQVWIGSVGRPQRAERQ